jgi:hypothetical protein
MFGNNWHRKKQKLNGKGGDKPQKQEKKLDSKVCSEQTETILYIYRIQQL